MRKRYLVGALVGVLGLALSAVAIASPQFKQTSKLKYSTSKAKRSTGFSVDLKGEDPGTNPPGDNPGVDNVTIKLKGSRFDPRGGRQCRLSQSAAPGCPRNTRVGSGSATAHIRGRNPTTGAVTLSDQINNTVTAFLYRKGLYVVVKPTGLPPVVLKAPISRGGSMKINVKRDVPGLPGGNKLVLEQLKLKIRKKSRGRGKRKRIMLRTPRCGKSRRFTSSVRFIYESEWGVAPVTNTVRQRCRK